MLLGRVRDRIAGLRAQAAHPNTGADEAAAFQQKADTLATKYGLRSGSSQLDEPGFPGPTPFSFARAMRVELSVVHLVSGFVPRAGSKTTAWCRCGYRTTPRTTLDRALAALLKDHPLDEPECVLCGALYATTNLRQIRHGDLWVLSDDVFGHEFLCCGDVQACVRRSNMAELPRPRTFPLLSIEHG